MSQQAIVETAVERVECTLGTPFRIARGTTNTVTNHLVRVVDEAGRVGIGSAAPSAYYDESPASVATVLPDLLAAVDAVEPAPAVGGLAAIENELVPIEAELAAVAPEQAAARAAVSIALHDLAATQREEPLYNVWDLDPTDAPVTSVTVGLDDSSAMATEAEHWRAAGYPTLKVKLGSDDDRARLAAVREAAPEARLRVDANGAWDVEQALKALSWLEAADVELLEQPVPAAAIEDLQRVTEATPLPVAADESCVTASDVAAVADAVDVVVVKLMKCGGIGPARRQLQTATDHGLDCMLGCMVETSASIAGACHLAPRVEYADLDGAILLEDNPCRSPAIEGGRIDLSSVHYGTGVDCS